MIFMFLEKVGCIFVFLWKQTLMIVYKKVIVYCVKSSLLSCYASEAKGYEN